jgi:hypothetical protein
VFVPWSGRHHDQRPAVTTYFTFTRLVAGSTPEKGDMTAWRIDTIRNTP